MNGLSRLQALAQEYSACVIQSPTNLHYFAGFTGTTAIAFVTATKAYIITDGRYTEQAQKQCEGYEVVQYKETPWRTICDIVQAEGLATESCAFEGDYMTVDTYERLRQGTPFGRYESVDLKELRAIKRADELVLMRKAAQIADEAFAVLLTKLQVGMTENEARIILETEMLKRGSSGPSFDTIIASGYRSSMPHGVASDKVIEDGDFVTFDFGSIYRGYHSDMTRTIVMGKASEQQLTLYDVVLRAQEKGVAGIRAGIAAKDIDALCRDSIAADGYGQYFNHGTGHGVGLDIHELPVASPRSEAVLETGMIVTVEPGVYLPGEIGLRIEDSVIVTNDGCEVLTKTPKSLIELAN